MKEIQLEKWETITDQVKEWLPLIEQRLYPKLEGTPEIGKFYRLYPEGCLSGNRGAYHGSMRVGSEKENLIVYFNGGGVSWNEYTAAHPGGLFSGNLKDRYYFNESEWIGDGVIDNGLASMAEENPFRNWSIIEFPCATGDFYCGNGDFPYIALDGTERLLPHHGYRNTLAVLEMARQWIGTPKKMLIAGSSAGGWGVALMAEDIIQFFEGCKDVTCLIDCSLLLKKDWREIAENVWQAPKHIVKRIHTDNLMLDSYMALYHKYGTKVRYLFDCSVRDEALVEMQNEFDGKGMIADRKGGENLEKRLQEIYSQMKEEMKGVGCFFFSIPTGNPEKDALGLTKHTILESPLQFEYKVEGKTLSEWLWNAVNGQVEQIGVNLLKVGDKK